MRSTNKSITLDVPLDIAFATWKNYNNFPKYIPPIIAVEKISSSIDRWVVDLLGYRIEFETGIDQLVYNKYISWHSKTPPSHLGSVYFARVDKSTSITVSLIFKPEDLSGNLLEDLDIARAEFDELFLYALESFKKYAEQTWRQMLSALCESCA